MGITSSHQEPKVDRKVKIEQYQWQSEEFSEEYALVYRSLEDESRTSTIRVSANPNKVSCSLLDYLCEEDDFRTDLEVINTDKDADYVVIRARLEKADWEAKVRRSEITCEKMLDQRDCPARRVHVSYKKFKSNWKNSSCITKETIRVEFKHIFPASPFPYPRLDYTFIVEIHCDKGEGLSVTMGGIELQSFSGSSHLGPTSLRIDHMVSGKPSDSSNNAIVRNKAKAKMDYNGVSSGGQGHNFQTSQPLAISQVRNQGANINRNYSGSAVYNYKHP